MDPRDFFPSGPPPPAQPPLDQNLAQRITKLALFAARNGAFLGIKHHFKFYYTLSYIMIAIINPS